MGKEKEFKPYIPADKVVAEFTPLSIILGALLAIIFGAANMYLGLRVGMSVSASIPAAVISMGVIRVILKRDSILENNIVQTIGSAGESVACGAIFTLPALFMWARESGAGVPSFFEITIVALIGGVLGVMFMIPLRTALIVQEHEVLPYPEGKACAEVLMAGEEGGLNSSTIFSGMGIAAAYKIVTDGLHLFPSEVHHEIKLLKGSGIGISVLPALLGVGYICGQKVAFYLLGGTTLGWFVIMPLIALFGGNTILYPGDVPIQTMTTWQIWSNYLRYVGAGAVAGGGIISLIKSLPLIIKTFRQAIKGFGVKSSDLSRTSRDISIKTVLIGSAVTLLFMWLCPAVPVNFLGAIIITVFGFFFATVSSRMVGLIGTSNNPISGMTIATLLITTVILKATGNIGTPGMIAAINIGSVICIITAVSSDTSQDLKTGYLIGATPKWQQIGELIGVAASAVTISGIMYLLDKAWNYGSSQLPAPQASLMKMVIEGVMNENLPWALVFIGIGIAVVIEILSIPVLPVAVGLYLPIHLIIPIAIGGLARLYFDKKKEDSEEKRKQNIDKGILYCSGLIAGEGLIGILLALLAVFHCNIDLSEKIYFGSPGALISFAILSATLFYAITKKEKKHGK